MKSTVDETFLAHWVTLIREQEPTAVAVFLHGSHARGEAGPHSDVDLTVLLPEPPVVEYRAVLAETPEGRLVHLSIGADSLDDWARERSKPTDWSLGFPVWDEARILWATDAARARIGEPGSHSPAPSLELEDFVEVFGKIKNARWADDELALRFHAQDLARRSAGLLYPLNPDTVVETPYEGLRAALDLRVVAPGYREDLLVCLGLNGDATDASEIYERATHLTTGVLTLLREHAATLRGIQPDLPRYLTDGTLLRYVEQGDDRLSAPIPRADVATRRILGRMVAGYISTQLLFVAAKLELADRLSKGPARAEELAATVGADPVTLRRLMRALTEIGVLTENADRSFSLTTVGGHLRRDALGSLWPAAICAGEPFFRAWGDLLESVRTGETAFSRVYGAPMFDYLAGRPEQREAFGQYMTGVSTEIAAAVAATFDASPYRTIVDVGGGHGTLLAALLAANPHATGILFDLPGVVAGAPPVLDAYGVTERCHRVGGSFFDAVPEGGDLYLMKWILHDWDDEHSLRILRACRRAMPPGARLAILETVMPERMTAGQTGALLDMHMLVLAGGHERTESEYRTLLAAAGFQLARIVATDPSAHSPVFGAKVSVIEAVPTAAGS